MIMLMQGFTFVTFYFTDNNNWFSLIRHFRQCCVGHWHCQHL